MLTPARLSPGTLVGRFLSSCRKDPDRVALKFEGRNWTYGELDDLTSRCALGLRAAGIEDGQRIAFSSDRRPEDIVVLLAILRAGGCYVAIDKSLPAARIAYLLRDSGASAMIRGSAGPEGPPGAEPAASVVHTLPELLEAGAASASKSGIDAVTGDSPAYVIYTSGTTGRPKGVEITHANVDALLTSALPLFDFGEKDVWSVLHAASFDFFVWELWGCFSTGGTAVLLTHEEAFSPESLCKAFLTHAVTIVNIVPSVFANALDDLAKAGRDLGNLRWLIFGGEPVRMDAVDAFRRVFPAVPRAVNMYGITEVTVHATFHELRPTGGSDSLGGSRIGAPLGHLEFAVLDGNLVPVAGGAVGELWISGASVASGYINRKGLSEERFRRLRIGGSFKDFYRTGDLVRDLGRDGFIYIGRNDEQVKVRGFRIELREIDVVVRSHGDVRDAACFVQREDADTTLCVGVVASLPDDESWDAFARRLRSYCREILPSHMVPARVERLERLPRSVNGKLDRASLSSATFGDAARGS